MKAFVYLVPENTYFAVIISQCIRVLNRRHPGCRHIVIPVYGIRFSSHPSLTNNFSIKSIKSKVSYYIDQARLSSRVRKLIEQDFEKSLKKNIRYLNIFDWVLAKTWSSPRIASSTDEQNFVNCQELKGIPIGDLVCDTYLRFKPSPLLDLHDSFVLTLLGLAAHYARLVDSVFKKSSVTCVIGSYTTYVYHGVPHRIANSNGVNTISFGNGQNFARLNKPGQLPLQVALYENYFYDQKHIYPSHLIKLARSSLFNRIHSSNDPTVPYMKQARELHEVKVDSCHGKIVVFLHDFYDSPHLFRWMLFPDFYTWIVNTIDFCIAQGITLFIKPHPNQCRDSEKVVSSLREKYYGCSCINWLDIRLRNSSIYAANPLLVVTVYGSVAPEACFAGIRVLLAGDHPAINFPIGKTARSRDEYFAALLNPSTVFSGDREAAISFTIQHNASLYQGVGQSLIGYLGCTWEDVNEHPELLKTTEVCKFINDELSRLFDCIEGC
jgi:hypothetical protein